MSLFRTLAIEGRIYALSGGDRPVFGILSAEKPLRHRTVFVRDP
jgi:hypothetical protein